MKIKYERGLSSGLGSGLGLREMRCYGCGELGYIRRDCISKRKLRWCSKCKSKIYDIEYCKSKGDRAKVVLDEEYYFAFSVNEYGLKDTVFMLLLVDIGAIIYILRKKEFFILFDKKFNLVDYYIELVDGKRMNNVG